MTMKRLATLGRRWRRAAAREEGSVAVETVIILPLLIWAYLAMFTIFDT